MNCGLLMVARFHVALLALLLTLLTLLTQTARATVAYWGSGGPSNGQFESVGGIEADAAGRVYVADSLRWRIQRFSPAGEFQIEWGGQGSLDGQFGGIQPYGPGDLAIGPDGTVYVADPPNNRIQRSSADGAFLSKWGSLGTQPGEFDTVVALATDSQGRVYTLEAGNHRVRVFTSTGVPMDVWGQAGVGDGEIGNAKDIAISPNNEVYISESNLSAPRIQRFTETGDFLGNWVLDPGYPGFGAGAPRGIAVDRFGNVYAGSGGRPFGILRFSREGAPLDGYSIPNLFSAPISLAVDHDANLFFWQHSGALLSLYRIGAEPLVGTVSSGPVRTGQPVTSSASTQPAPMWGVASTGWDLDNDGAFSQVPGPGVGRNRR